MGEERERERERKREREGEREERDREKCDVDRTGKPCPVYLVVGRVDLGRGEEGEGVRGQVPPPAQQHAQPQAPLGAGKIFFFSNLKKHVNYRNYYHKFNNIHVMR